MNAELLQFSGRVFTALLNGVYQGVILTGAVWLILRFLTRTNAATRYAIWGITLVAVLALPILHFALEKNREIGTLASDGELLSLLPAKSHFVGEDRTARPAALLSANEPSGLLAQPEAANPEMETDRTFTGADVFDATGQASFTAGTFAPDSGIAEPPFSDDLPGARAGRIEGVPPLRAELGNPTVTGEARAQDEKQIFSGERLLNRFRAFSIPFAFPGYPSACVLLALVLLGLARAAGLIRQVQLLRVIKASAQAAPEGLARRCEAIRLSQNPSRAATLLVSDGVTHPMVVGFLHPAILIPKHLVQILQPEQLDSILRHELAHIHRWDDWGNLIQQGAKAMFGLHPGVSWICRRLTIEREIACDDYVLHAGHKARDYALFLTEIASRSDCRIWSAAPAAWSKTTQLTERVNMILKKNRSVSPRLGFARLGILSTTSAALAVAMFQIAPRLTAAAETTAPGTTASASKGSEARTTGASTLIVGPSGQTLVTTIPEANAQSLVVAGSSSAEPRLFVIADSEGKPRVSASGPRKKEPRAGSESEQDTPPEAPEGIPTPAIAPTPPVAPAPVGPGKPARAGSPAKVREEKPIEERLSRVERLLEQVLSQRSLALAQPHAETFSKPQKFDFAFPQADVNWEMRARKFDQDAQAFARHPDALAMHANAEARGREKAAADAAGRLSQVQQELEQRRHMLEAQRASLEKQLEAIERQVEDLEKQQEKLEKDRERHEEKGDKRNDRKEDSKAQKY